VGSALTRYLSLSFQQETALSSIVQCQFKVISSGELAVEEQQPLDKVVSLFLHRITVDEHTRMPARLPDSPLKRALLSVELHYLITYWGTSAEDEQLMLAWVMQQLQLNPILDTSLLAADAGWGPDESLQVVRSNLSLEDIMRIWDAIGPKYRLSLGYTIRPVRIDVTQTPTLPVVATRFIEGDMKLQEES
jgi:Pvc16 N-terminal domain